MTTLRDPILGERAKLALRIDAGGTQRRKLLVLLAAYADAGITNPPLRVLMKRAGIPRVEKADHLLRSLESQGLIRVEWSPGRPQRNRYELLFAGERDDGRDAAGKEQDR